MTSDVIWEYLLNGTVDDWEQIAKEADSFPDGNELRDSYVGYVDHEWCVGSHWITNAVSSCSLELVAWMISKKVNLHFMDGDGYTVLHACIERERPDRYDILRLLIASGADVNAGAELGNMAINGWTPLHMAACYNDVEAVKILLEAGADTAIKTSIDYYVTAEEEARQSGSYEVAELIRMHDTRQKCCSKQ